MGFTEGFANAFVAARQRSEDAKARKDELTLKYTLEDASRYRTQVEERKAKQLAIKQQAESIAATIGEPRLASRFMTEIQAGRNQKEILEDYRSGSYKEKKPQSATLEMPNPDLKVPAGIGGQYSQDQLADPIGSSPLDSSVKTTTKIPEAVSGVSEAKVTNKAAPMPSTPEEAQALEYDPQTAKKIYEVSKDLGDAYTRTGKYSSDKAQEISTTIDDGFEYVPPKVAEKFPSLAEANYARMEAQRTGDKVGQIKAEQQIRAWSYAMEAQKPDRPDVNRYANISPDGTIRFFSGTKKISEDGIPYVEDEDTHARVNGTVKYIDKDDYKDIGPVYTRYQKASEDYKIGQAKTVAAMETGVRMVDLATRFDVASSDRVGPALTWAKNLVDNAQAAASLWQKEGSAEILKVSGIQKKLEEDLSAGNFEAVSHGSAKLKEALNGLMSKGVTNEAQAAVLYETYKNSLAYDLAAAKGQTGQGLSQKDFQQFKDSINGQDPQLIRDQILGATSSVIRSLSVVEDQLNNDNMDVKGLEMRLGFKMDISVPRFGKVIETQYKDAPEMRQQVMQMFNDSRNGSFQMPDSTLDAEDHAKQKVTTEQKTQIADPNYRVNGATYGGMKYIGPTGLNDQDRKNPKNYEKVQ